jgi:putative ribosome biogenesis GTPase RsgA
VHIVTCADQTTGEKTKLANREYKMETQRIVDSEYTRQEMNDKKSIKNNDRKALISCLLQYVKFIFLFLIFIIKKIVWKIIALNTFDNLVS